MLAPHCVQFHVQHDVQRQEKGVQIDSTLKYNESPLGLTWKSSRLQNINLRVSLPSSESTCRFLANSNRILG